MKYAQKSEQELNKELSSKREALKNFRFSMWGSKTRNTKEGRMIRREIARIMTEMNKKHLENNGK